MKQFGEQKCLSSQVCDIIFWCALTVVCCSVQFGKVDSYSYIMDYNPAEISAIQAFAISLSTFDTKLLL